MYILYLNNVKQITHKRISTAAFMTMTDPTYSKYYNMTDRIQVEFHFHLVMCCLLLTIIKSALSSNTAADIYTTAKERVLCNNSPYRQLQRLHHNVSGGCHFEPLPQSIRDGGGVISGLDEVLLLRSEVLEDFQHRWRLQPH
jgi:hypothetical protein